MGNAWLPTFRTQREGLCVLLENLTLKRELHLVRFGKADMLSGQRRYSAIVWAESIKHIARESAFRRPLLL